MNETKLTGKTPDIAEENIQQLKTLFPDVFTEGKIDFKKLQQVLGEYIDAEGERYNFTWNGKAKALRLAQTPSTGTLRPCKEESKEWDTTQNLYIEGDNLEVLKLLQKSYHGKVKMIYIDPPYNTGNDFVYPDNFTDSIENYKEITGQVDSAGNSISSNAETSGRYHTDWLNMMYPRLRLARNLLSDDGVLFISIDDNEQKNLKAICDECFGEFCFVGSFIWKRRTSSAMDARQISADHEFVLCYSKTQQMIFNGSPKDYKGYSNPDKDPRGLWTNGDLTVGMNGDMRPNQYYELTDPETGKVYKPNYNRVWAYIPESMQKLINENRVIFPADTSKRPMLKRFARELKSERNPFSTWMDNIGLNTEGTRAISALFNDRTLFNYAKPVSLIKTLIGQVTKDEDIILDFFSGAATTAHAVMQLNAEDNGKRKFIMAQLPEPTREEDEAYKAGYKNICEIGKERIRRAGDKIKEEAGLLATNLDIGFKIFKLDSSNIRKWQPDYDNLEMSLTDYIDNYIEGRSEMDVVYEIILKCGLDLTYSIDEYTFADQKVYSIGFGALMICLDDNITTAVAEGMVKLKNELQPETWKVVFKDNGFHNDSNKTNIKEILKCGGLDDDAFTTL